MSRFKRFAIGTAITLGIMAGAVPLWHQSHYKVSFDSPVTVALPSPNGYDTITEAMKLRRGYYLWLQNGQGLWQPLEYRRKLLADNQALIAKMRMGLEQDYHIPEAARQTLDGNASLVNGCLELGALLRLAAATHAEQNNLPEAMRCALDSIALGVQVPCGGSMSHLSLAYSCKEKGLESAWELVDRVDAKTARQAVTRLEKIEAQRWPVAENLREDMQGTFRALYHQRYARGPLGTWKDLNSWLKITGEDYACDLWTSVTVVYEGPKVFVDYANASIKDLQDLAQKPWDPQQARLPATQAPIHTYDAYGFSYLEFQQRGYRAFSLLLRTSLALRAYKLEHGSYPNSLESLKEEGYLAMLPIDPFSPTLAPLRYRKSPEGTMTLWSVGPDTKDDNGKALHGFTWLDKKQGYLPGDIVAGRTACPQYWKNDRE